MSSVPTVSSQNQPSTLHPSFLENSQKNADQWRRRALTQYVLSRICAVAFIAITGAILAASFGLLTVTSLPAWFPLVLIVASILLEKLAILCNAKSIVFSRKFESEQLVADELRRIQHWKRPQIEDFFNDNHLDVSLDSPPFEALQRVNAQDPLSILLPLIARYRVQCRKGVELVEESLKALCATPPQEESKRLHDRLTAWNTLESQAIPTLLNAAFTLQILSHPFLAFKNLQEVGEIQARTFEGRMSHLLFDREEKYFTFREANRKPLNLFEDFGLKYQEKIPDELHPSSLRHQVFQG